MHFEFIIYVADQDKSASFYSILLAADAVLHVPGMTEFELSPSCKLGIMPEQGIAKILGPMTEHPSKGNGIPRCEIYLLVDDLTVYYERAIQLEAKFISEVMMRDWGHRACYFSDPDGHIIAFAEECKR